MNQNKKIDIYIWEMNKADPELNGFQQTEDGFRILFSIRQSGKID